jgi:hypothetical protein
MSNSSRGRHSCLPALLALLAFGSISNAQQTATVTGTAVDPSSASIAGVHVTLRNNGTGQARTTDTNTSGGYTFTDLQVGTYTLIAEMNGFKKYEQTGIVVNLNATTRADVSMQVGDLNQSVTVEAEAVQVQSETSEISNLISGAQVTQLATNGRNPIQLATLLPGASSNLPDFNAPNALSQNSSISFNGQRSDHNVWMIDGGEDYDRGSGGGFSVTPSPDAIAEFRVITSNYSPEFGQGSGGIVTLALRSGTRQFHGGLWEFNRNDALDANDFFANRAGTNKPELRFNTYGFNIGGPVFIPKVYNTSRQKTFFFYNMEWRKLRQGTVITHVTFPEAFYSGDLSAVTKQLNYPTTTNPAVGFASGAPIPGNRIPANLIDPNAALLLQQGVFPFPNTTGNQWTGSRGVPTDVREEIVRIDHQITDKLALMGHFIDEQANQVAPLSQWSGQTFPTLGTNQNSPSYSAVARLVWTISPTVLNEASYNYNGNRILFSPNGIYQKPAGWNIPEFFGSNNLNRLPNVDIAGAYSTNYEPSSWPWYNAADSNQVRDDISITRGAHNMKMGASFMRYRKNQDLFGSTQGAYNFNGSFTGDAFADFLLGYANTYQELAIQDRGHWRNSTYGVYFVDNWKVSKRLTLNLGLRWEGIPQAYDVQDRMSNFVPGNYNPGSRPVFNADGSLDPNGPGFSTVSGVALYNTPFYLNGIGIAGRDGFPRDVVQDHWNNYGPRVGFAYDPTGAGKTAIRGGFGMFYERVQGNAVYNMATDPPFSYNPSLSNVLFSNPAINATTGLQAALPIFPASMTTLAYNDFKIPTTMMWNFQLQQQLAASTVFGVAYVGSGSYHQPDYREINAVPLEDPNRAAIAGGTYTANLDRPFAGFSNIKQLEAASGANYHSLQLSIRMENKYGLTLQGAYTYSKELDYASGDNATQLSNPFDRNFDYGPGDLNRKHAAVVSYIYELPFYRTSPNPFLKTFVGGWQVSGIVTVQTGLPLTPTIGNDILGLGGNATARPNTNRSINYPKTADAWFSPSSFTQPAFGFFGDTSRGLITGPGRQNWNISLFKSFRGIPFPGNSEGAEVQFRAETFNTFNHTQFHDVTTNFNDGNFGRVTSVYDPRVIQLALKFLF